jgi:NADH-ubiquinone oxidoreductase chain 6
MINLIAMVISLVFLIFTFVNAALYLIIFGIIFIGISYIILYIGAITVIFLFIIMMINIKLSDITEETIQYTKNIPLAILIGSLFIYEIFNILPFTFNDATGLTYLLKVLTNLNLFFINLKYPLIDYIYITYNPANCIGNTFSWEKLTNSGEPLKFMVLNKIDSHNDFI